MNSLTPSPSSFVETEEHYSLRWYRFGIVVAAVLGLIGFIQTEAYVNLVSSKNAAQVRNDIDDARQSQAAITKGYKGAKNPKGIDIYERLFDESELPRLRDAKEFVLANPDFEEELRRTYGYSLRDVDVVIVPGWRIDTKDNNEQMGITEDGWRACAPGKGESNVGGFTIRDYSAVKQRTTDGRPRIFLNANAFQSTSVTRLTLFHEMLHAMNIPGYYPTLCFLTFAQNDLTYLPEYRDLTEKAGLEGWGEYLIWGLGVLAPWVVSLFIYRQSRICRRRELGI